MKELLMVGMQACINSYKGKHGKVEKIFDYWQENVYGNVEYYFGEKNDELWIVFRGSDDWKDWVQNFDTNGIDINSGTMHQGTYEDHIKVSRHCLSEIKKNKKVFITGHSKGGMQALILYYFAKLNYPSKDITCLAYAPAKTMSKRFLDFMKDAYTIINGEDYICKLPQWKFKHMGKIIRIGKRDLLLWIPFIRIIGVKDHYPEKYLKEIQNAKQDKME